MLFFSVTQRMSLSNYDGLEKSGIGIVGTDSKDLEWPNWGADMVSKTEIGRSRPSNGIGKFCIYLTKINSMTTNGPWPTYLSNVENINWTVLGDKEQVSQKCVQRDTWQNGLDLSDGNVGLGFYVSMHSSNKWCVFARPSFYQVG